MSKVAVVTGGTSGIGRATALALKDAGYTVYELSRRAEGVEGLHHISADVTDQQAVNDAAAQIMAAEGRIDVLVNNAGFGISGAIEFTETAEAKALFDVNFFGMVNMNRAVVPLMRQAGRGRIVNLSSVAAPVPIPFQAYYLRHQGGCQRLHHGAGQRAAALRRNGMRRDAGGYPRASPPRGRRSAPGTLSIRGRISRSVKRMEHDEETGMDPARPGAYIASVAMREGHHHPLYAIRFDYKFFTFLAKVLPARFLNWLIYCLYGK